MSKSGAAAVEQRDRRRGEPLPPPGRTADKHASKEPCGCGCGGPDAVSHTAPGATADEGSLAESAPGVAAAARSMAPGRLRAMARRRAQSRSGSGAAGDKRPSGSASPTPEADAHAGPGAEPGQGAHAPAVASIITGTVAGSGSHVTGAEPGRSGRVTGTEYLPRGREEEARKSSVGMKVGRSRTTRGGIVSGTPLGRSLLVTGNEPGSCKMVTGNEYVGGEQYADLCAKPAPSRRPAVAASLTTRNGTVTGNLPGRSSRVTGDEPGTCEVVTGTPYAGKEQIEAFCDEGTQAAAAARTRTRRATPGPELTGQQPGLNGRLTGAERGACEAVTGTPYVGKDQYQSTCGTSGQESAGGGAGAGTASAPWTDFSVMSPARAARLRNGPGEDGSRGQITGPFGMGRGKVTGTEAFRNGGVDPSSSEDIQVHSAPAAAPAGRIKRITGEGIDAGLRITGDDWDRGDRVTGTEGSSSTVRNPTRRGGPMTAMVRPSAGHRTEPAAPESRVTGGAGASARGALVTVSGGARG